MFLYDRIIKVSALVKIIGRIRCASRRSSAKPQTRDEARRIAADIAKPLARVRDLRPISSVSQMTIAN
jgi:hypothetical protein